MQVLMIEDLENDFLLVSRLIAKSNDLKIEWRDTLEKGLAYIKSNPVDVLLLDISLPDSYGLGALNQVQIRFHVLPIIILSDDDTNELALEAVRQGAQDYLVKGTFDGQILDRSLHYAVERKRLEKRFRSLLEAAPDATVIVNHDGNIVLVNSQTERIFGYSREELIGKPVEILVPASFRAHHPEHRSQYTNAPRVRMMGTGLELYALRKDGSQFPVEISLSPIETEDGILIASAIRDISERKQVEQALRNSEAQFR
ncbi:MAG TPA: PAS domain S-box protein, partial [Phototrophicaceae bacterium]|nr:PAS domain S-box protein [Phototrophicaceae bacterium]